LVGNGKRFIAYELIKRLKHNGHDEMLKILKAGVSMAEQKKGQLHKVFEESFDLKICKTQSFIKQKLDYIHRNPCSKKWKLVENPINYKHSSMKFYDTYGNGIKSKLTPYTMLLE